MKKLSNLVVCNPQALLTVEYLKGTGLQTELFLKVPWNMDVNSKYRYILSLTYGDGGNTNNIYVSILRYLL